MEQKERRKYKRLDVSFEVFISLLDRKNNIDGEKLKADSVNISASGMLFNFDDNLKIGTYLFITFFPPSNDNEIIVHGKVVRSKKKKDDVYAIAVHFMEFEKGDESELNRLLQ